MILPLIVDEAPFPFIVEAPSPSLPVNVALCSFLLPVLNSNNKHYLHSFGRTGLQLGFEPRRLRPKHLMLRFSFALSASHSNSGVIGSFRDYHADRSPS